MDTPPTSGETEPDRPSDGEAASAGRSRSVPRSREERRRQIVEATLAILAEEGMHGWTTAALAERVGASEATLYKHFENKEAILAEAVRRQAAGLRERIEEYRSEGTTWEKIAGLVRHLLDFCEEAGGGPLVVLVGPASHLPPHLHQELRAPLSLFRERVREFMAERASGEARARTVADLMLAIVQSSLLRWLMEGGEMRPREIARPMLELAGQSVTGALGEGPR